MSAVNRAEEGGGRGKGPRMERQIVLGGIELGQLEERGVGRAAKRCPASIKS